ncbi:MAG: TetR/AcrR family transcriptional regulator [Bifidobacterium sp.]|uniref:TetR/AcrR family transcriptional regulator n=1 Tax=Bifidobacterium sp. TaxID=41200 RepID=UPI0039E8832C
MNPNPRKNNQAAEQPGSSESSRAPSGLRESKKRKIREQIRAAALSLFATQGYGQTTLEQVAATAQVAPRTLYRYFPTKDSLVVTDEDDEAMLDNFKQQLDQYPPIEALRRAFHAVLFDEETNTDQLRRTLIAAEPELQAANLRLVIGLAERYADAIAEHTGQPGNVEAALSLTGAAAGIALATVQWNTRETKSAQLQRFDSALDRLEHGFGL